MSTWLAIARRVRKECGLSGTDTSPSSVVGQTGEMLHIVNWVDSAWRAIQGSKTWDWQWEQPELTLLAGTNLIAGTVSHHRYVKDSMWYGTGRLHYMAWSDFRLAYPQASIGDGTPSHWSVRPDRSIVFSAKPAADMDLTVERYAEQSGIPADEPDAASPPMPADQHDAIMWRAVMFYAAHDEAGSLYQTARAEYRRIMGDAAIEDLPDYEFGEPLA